MRGRFMPASHDLTRKVWHLLDGLADHEGRDLHSMFVEQIKKPGNALVDAVLKEGVRRQIGKTLLNGIRNDTTRSRDWLPAALKHE